MKIKDIDREKSSSSDDYADRFLVLDGKISENWVYFFDKANSDTFSTMKRPIRFQGQYIVVTCPMDELQSQINQINKHCSFADEQLKNWEDVTRRQEEEKKRAQEDESTKANEAYDRLKF